jgi:hypothetical protein
MAGRLIGSVGLSPGSDEGTDLTTKGDLHGYSTSNTRIPIGSNNQVLTADSTQALGLKWADPAGGGTWEFIDTQTSTGNDFTTFTFSTAVDFDDYSEFLAVFNIGTGSSRDICFQVGDTSQGGVMTGNYQQQKSDNTAGTWTSESHSGEAQWCPASHPRIDSADGVSGWHRVYLAYYNDGTQRLMEQAMIQGQDSLFIAGGYNTTSQDDLKYYRIYIGANDLVSGSNVTCYKLKRS